MSVYAEYGEKERERLENVYDIEILESKLKWLRKDQETLAACEKTLLDRIAQVEATPFSEEVVIIPRNYGKKEYFVTFERTPVIDGIFTREGKVTARSERFEHTPTEGETYRKGYTRGRPAAVAKAIEWAKEHQCRIRSEMDLTKGETRQVFEAGLPLATPSAEVIFA